MGIRSMVFLEAREMLFEMGGETVLRLPVDGEHGGPRFAGYERRAASSDSQSRSVFPGRGSTGETPGYGDAAFGRRTSR